MGANEKSGDAELVRRSLDGDNEAFASLFTKYEVRVLSYVVGQADNREDAEDIIQNVFLTAFQDLENLKDSGKFPNWLFGIARRLAAAKRRERRKGINYESDNDGFDETMALKEAAVIAYRADQQRAERERHKQYKAVCRIMSQLPESQRQVLLLHYAHDMSHKAIAQRLGITDAAVNSRLQRARENVKRLVREAEDDERH